MPTTKTTVISPSYKRCNLSRGDKKLLTYYCESAGNVRTVAEGHIPGVGFFWQGEPTNKEAERKPVELDDDAVDDLPTAIFGCLEDDENDAGEKP
jgi:hypothetical protein